MEIYASDTVPVPFELCGGHPALDFVNSLDDRFDATGRKELLANYDALLRFAGEAGLLSAPQVRGLARATSTAAGSRVMRSAHELREALAAVLYAAAERRAPATADIETLERRLQEAQCPRRLEWMPPKSGGHPSARWEWRADQIKAAEFPLWLIAQAASRLIFSDAIGHVRACEANSCRWLFLDTSKNHTRRWCNMKVCGNRAKARRFQERRAG